MTSDLPLEYVTFADVRPPLELDPRAREEDDPPLAEQAGGADWPRAPEPEPPAATQHTAVGDLRVIATTVPPPGAADDVVTTIPGAAQFATLSTCPALAEADPVPGTGRPLPIAVFASPACRRLRVTDTRPACGTATLAVDEAAAAR